MRNRGGENSQKTLTTAFPASPKGKFEATVYLSFDFIQPLLWEIMKGKARIFWNRLRAKLHY